MSFIEDILYTPNLATLTADVTAGNVLPKVSQLTWVTDTDKFYRLIALQDGTNIAHWQDLQLDIANFLEYNPLNSYVVGNAVRIGQTLYVCIVDSGVGISPITDPANYLVLQGATAYVIQSFTGVTSVTVNHTLNLTSVQVFVDRSGSLVMCHPHIEIASATQVLVNFNSTETGEVRLK